MIEVDRDLNITEKGISDKVAKEAPIYIENNKKELKKMVENTLVKRAEIVK